jgi:hypothetical protein
MIQALTGVLMGSPKNGNASGNPSSPTAASNNINMMPRGKGKVQNRTSSRSSDLPEELKNMNKIMNELKVKDSLVGEEHLSSVSCHRNRSASLMLVLYPADPLLLSIDRIIASEDYSSRG